MKDDHLSNFLDEEMEQIHSLGGRTHHDEGLLNWHVRAFGLVRGCLKTCNDNEN